MLPEITIPDRYNYIAAFLTLACNLNCSYCINLHEDPTSGRGRIITKHMTAEEWIEALNRIQPRLPITLQGGEPTVFKHFYAIMEGVRKDHKFDLLTNMQFDEREFVARVPIKLFDREAPYAPIRVSYHPGQNKIEEIVRKALFLKGNGYRVGIYGVLHPAQKDQVLKAQAACQAQGLDFRTKEYLGKDGGTFKYPEAIQGDANHFCWCRTSELLISPSGHIMRCHSDLYEGRQPVGHVLQRELRLDDTFKQCYVYGHCNPCDVKVKTNRFQEYGHTSCEITGIRDLRPQEEEALAMGNYGL